MEREWKEGEKKECKWKKENGREKNLRKGKWGSKIVGIELSEVGGKFDK
jgi:hypothetical protein